MATSVHVCGTNRPVRKQQSMVIYMYYSGHMRMAVSGLKRHGLKLLRGATWTFVSTKYLALISALQYHLFVAVVAAEQ
jgi:hypothetical protein